VISILPVDGTIIVFRSKDGSSPVELFGDAIRVAFLFSKTTGPT
jgi:hypothetical protein